jgi:hypothetical protein
MTIGGEAQEFPRTPSNSAVALTDSGEAKVSKQSESKGKRGNEPTVVASSTVRRTLRRGDRGGNDEGVVEAVRRLSQLGKYNRRHSEKERNARMAAWFKHLSQLDSELLLQRKRRLVLLMSVAAEDVRHSFQHDLDPFDEFLRRQSEESRSSQNGVGGLFDVWLSGW